MKILTITKFKLLLSVVICLLVESCDTKQNGKIYQISQDNNNLYITMPHPTIGIVGINEVSWRGVDLDELTNDIYTTLKKQHLSDIYSLYVKFETTSTDKYGNVEKNYKEAFLFEVPVEEVRKYICPICITKIPVIIDVKMLGRTLAESISHTNSATIL